MNNAIAGLIVALVALQSALAAPAAGWKYETKRDELRDEAIHLARIESRDKRGLLVIRNAPNKLSVHITIIGHGIIRYNLTRNVTFDYRIDQAQPYPSTGGVADDGATVFLASPHDKVREIAAARRLVVEIPTHARGNVQLVFDVTGLNPARVNLPH